MTEETPNDGTISDRDLTVLWATRDIVCAMVSKPGSYDLPALIGDVHGKLTVILVGEPQDAADVVDKPDAAQIRRSITPDGLISFIDGKSYKTMKRHLSKHNLTPETYRTRYGLPNDYPMVAASYSAQRTALAKSMGLGQQRRQAA